jgi:hypothetical protein
MSAVSSLLNWEKHLHVRCETLSEHQERWVHTLHSTILSMFSSRLGRALTGFWCWCCNPSYILRRDSIRHHSNSNADFLEVLFWSSSWQKLHLQLRGLALAFTSTVSVAGNCATWQFLGSYSIHRIDGYWFLLVIYGFEFEFYQSFPVMGFCTTIASSNLYLMTWISIGLS